MADIAVNPDVLPGGWSNPTPTPAPWPTCVTQQVHDEAVTACQRLQTELRGFGLSDPYVSDPCRASQLPVCKKNLLPSLPDWMRREKAPNTPAAEDSGALLVGGVLLLLAAGGVGYYVYKKRSKR